jgi:hypothetical protein
LGFFIEAAIATPKRSALPELTEHSRSTAAPRARPLEHKSFGSPVAARAAVAMPSKKPPARVDVMNVRAMAYLLARLGSMPQDKMGGIRDLAIDGPELLRGDGSFESIAHRFSMMGIGHARLRRGE